MTRRLLPTLILMSLGFAALTFGLVRLAGIFEAERRAAVAAAEAQRNALREYASRALAERLRARLRAAEEEVALALADPLRSSEGLALVKDGRQVLPVLPRPHPAASEADDPAVAERRRRTDAFMAALQAGDQAAQERTMRALLAHRALFVMAPEFEVEAAVELLEAFTRLGAPHAELMRGLLREGVQGVQGRRVEGVQRLLLRGRPGMPAAKVQELARRIEALSRDSGAPSRDFSAAAARPLGPDLGLGAPPGGAVFLPGGAWVIGPHEGDGIIGRAQPLAPVVEVIGAEMVGRGLLRPDERLAAPGLEGVERRALTELEVRLEGPRVAEAEATAQEAFDAKRAMLGLTWLLGLAIVVLAGVAQERKGRFVQLKEDFVSMVSHELRTPLASIRVMAETLGRKVGGRPEARDYPQRIVRAADRLHGLVENVLTFERAERGRLTPRREEVRLGDAVDRASEGLPADVAKADGVDELIVNADPELLTLLLSNLANNACRHGGRPTGVRIEVAADVGDPGDPVIIRLSDNGRGIAARDRERVFDEFRRGPSDQAGTGLGLAICRRIMRAHGGEIRIADSGPEGTTFEMRFPAA